MIVVGIDCHTRTHFGAAVDAQGRVLGTCEVDASEAGLAQLVQWLGRFRGDRLVAVEGAHGCGLPLTRRLLAARESVVDIPSQLTASGRRSSRRRGKDDEGDAIVIARVALREVDLPRLQVAHLDADLKLLVDARDQLVAESTRVRNRLHALLLVLAPGYRAQTGALISHTALDTAPAGLERHHAAPSAQPRWQPSAQSRTLHRRQSPSAMGATCTRLPRA